MKQSATSTTKKWRQIVMCALAVATVILAGCVIYYAKADPIDRFKKDFPLLDPARAVVSQGNFFSTVQPLRKSMNDIVTKYAANGNQIGVYFEYLDTGANITINADTRFWPASLSKVPTAFAAVKKVQDGTWKLTDLLTLQEQDRDSRFGDLYQQPAGTQLSVETLIKDTLIQSDNSAHSVLVHNLTAGDYTSIFEALGLQDLFDSNYDINAKEYSRLYKALYESSYLNQEYSQMVIRWLTETPFTELLGQGVPQSVPFSHKIGEDYEHSIFLDSGIVYVPERPYLITVMIKVGDKGGIDTAGQIMKELSTAAYQFVSQHQ